jgi:hypothetical protein
MVRGIAIVILLLSFPILLVAQDSTIPPDPTTLFTDAIKVIEVISSSVQTTDSLLVYDNRNGVILFEDETYPYPDDIYYIEDVIAFGNQQWLLEVGDSSVGSLAVENFLLFDATAGTFTLPENVCDGQAKMPASHGQWVFDDSSGKKQLCFTATGELRDISLGELADAPLWVASQSPDKMWLLLESFDYTTLAAGYTFYGYNLAENELKLLGIVENDRRIDGYFDTDEWVSNTLGSMIFITPPDGSPDAFYIFDVSRSNSLELVEWGYAWRGKFKDNPPRFEYSRTNEYVGQKFGGYSSEYLNCSFWQYDATGMHEYDLGYDCEIVDRGDGCQALHPVGEGYVYLQYFESRLPTLTYLDTTTGKKYEMFSADIESIISVSPDGQYVALLIDNNGITDFKDNFCSEFGRNWAAYGNAWLLIVYLSLPDTVDFFYQTEFSTDDYDYPQISANTIFWGESRFLIVQGEIKYLIPLMDFRIRDDRYRIAE